MELEMDNQGLFGLFRQITLEWDSETNLPAMKSHGLATIPHCLSGYSLQNTQIILNGNLHRGIIKENALPSDVISPSSMLSDITTSSSVSSSKDERSLVWTELTVMSVSPSTSESIKEKSLTRK